MSLTIELLESMLSPDAGHRRSAEAAYGAIRRPDRLLGLTSILLLLPPPSSSSSSDIGGFGDRRRDDCCGEGDDGRGTMAAVLLRREIGALDDRTAATAASMVEIAEPLLALFRRMGGEGGGAGAGSGSANSNARRQLGHCIAELCRALSSGGAAIPAPHDDGGRGWMRTVLTNLGPGVSFQMCGCSAWSGRRTLSFSGARVCSTAFPRSLSPFFFSSLLFRLPFFPPR